MFLFYFKIAELALTYICWGKQYYYCKKNDNEFPTNCFLLNQDQTSPSQIFVDVGLYRIFLLLLITFFQLEPILNAQVLLSADGGKLTPVHDEHLFIVTHQSKLLCDWIATLCLLLLVHSNAYCSVMKLSGQSKIADDF